MRTIFPVKIRSGFTLIELLIVVAIIAILAAIAVPNFLEAQVRAKVSRAKSDLRTFTTALESYRVDTNRYPPTPFFGSAGVLRVIPTRLSTPVAYITSAGIPDVFVDSNLGDFEYFPPSGTKQTYTGAPGEPESFDPRAGARYYYQLNNDPRRSPSTLAALQAAIPFEGEWVMASYGPDRRRNLETVPNYPVQVLLPYDPTNGTISAGDIVRTQRQSDSRLP